MQTRSKKWLLLVAVVAVLGYLVYRFRTLLNLANFSVANLWSTIRGINLGLLCLAMLLIYACYAVRSLRWQAMQRNIGPSRFLDIYTVTLAGFAAVNILSRAGEPIRPLLLARKAKHPIADIFGIWALERLIDTASFAIILAIGLIAYRPRAGTGEMSATIAAAKVGGGVLGGAVAAVVVVLAYLRLHGSALLESRMQLWTESKGWRAKAAKIVLGFVRGIQTIKSWSDLVTTILYSALHWVLVLVVYVLVCKSFGGDLAHLGLSDCTMLLGLTLVGSIIQLPAVGGGFQTAAFVVLTKLFGILPEPATAAALLLWLIAFVACSIVGVPVLIREGVSLGQLRQLAEHEKEELEEIAAHGSAGTNVEGGVEPGGKGEWPE
jgi:uncharacterized protein (TIRG00374 family)